MKTRKRKIILILIGIVVLLLTGRWIYIKMTDYLDGLDTQIAEVQTNLSLARKELDDNSEFVEKWNRISSFKNAPMDERGTKLTAYLDSLAADLNIVYQNLSAPSSRPFKDNQEFQMLRYKLVFPADLKDLVEFLHRLDSSDRLIRIDRLQINRRKTSYSNYYETPLPSTKDLTVEITISIPTAVPKTESSPETPLT